MVLCSCTLIRLFETATHISGTLPHNLLPDTPITQITEDDLAATAIWLPFGLGNAVQSHRKDKPKLLLGSDRV